jgi:hypothetical protein
LQLRVIAAALRAGRPMQFHQAVGPSSACRCERQRGYGEYHSVPQQPAPACLTVDTSRSRVWMVCRGSKSIPSGIIAVASAVASMVQPIDDFPAPGQRHRLPSVRRSSDASLAPGSVRHVRPPGSHLGPVPAGFGGCVSGPRH